MMNEPFPFAPFLDQARGLHRRIPVIMPYLEYYGYSSLFDERGGAQCDLEKLDAAGIRAFGIALTNGGVTYFEVGPNEYEVAGPPEWAYERTKKNFDAALKDVQRCSRVKVILNARDLRPDSADATIGVIPLITCNSYLLDIAALEDMFARGLRISHCAGGTCIKWCRSYGAARVGGKQAPVFSEFGRALIARMNELGIVIDLAHMSDESSEAIIAASAKPVIDGHTGSRTVVPHSRGHSDGTLKKIADSGGVAGIHFADGLFTTKVHGPKYAIGAVPQDYEPRLRKYNRHLLATVTDPEERFRLRKNRAAQDAFFKAHNLPPDPAPSASGQRIATVSDMAEHIEHMVKVMGIEHVGLGGDINGIQMDSWPLGMDHLGELPHLTAELLRRGHSEEELEKFLCGNWLRVFRECLPAGTEGKDVR